MTAFNAVVLAGARPGPDPFAQAAGVPHKALIVLQGQTLLARVDWRRDLFVLSEVAQDTLDYTGPEVNKGSKALLLGLGEPIRELPERWPEEGALPDGIAAARAYCRGCLVVQGTPFEGEPDQASRMARHPGFADWPLIVLVDDLAEATASTPMMARSKSRCRPVPVAVEAVAPLSRSMPSGVTLNAHARTRATGKPSASMRSKTGTRSRQPAAANTG